MYFVFSAASTTALVEVAAFNLFIVAADAAISVADLFAYCYCRCFVAAAAVVQ